MLLTFTSQLIITDVGDIISVVHSHITSTVAVLREIALTLGCVHWYSTVCMQCDKH